MPELPEVETIVRYLRPRIRGRRILQMESNTPRLFRDQRSAAEVSLEIVGQKIEDISRTGKNILFRLSSGKSLAIHLMMTGTLLLDPPPNHKFTRCSFLLSGNRRLAFSDVRKFGRIRVVGSEEKIGGSDALSLTLKKLKELVRIRKGRIKPLLLNQNIISGIGNIYSDEILWQAGINPLRKNNSLQARELHALHSSIRRVLRLAIKKEGSSVRNYVKPDGSGGRYFEFRKAYQRTGEPCRRCGGIIERVIVGQRSTHFCPRHQV